MARAVAGVRPGRISVWQALTAVILLALGFLFVIQARSGQQISRAPEVQTRNVFALAAELQTERAARQSLETEVTGLRQQLDELERLSTAGRTATAAMQRELETLRIAVGLRAVRGPGVTVEVAEPPVRSTGSPVTVQYNDLVGIINELWAAGAEAIALNDVRVTATTGLSQVGTTIVAGLKRLDPPFRVAAVGDPATLDGALQIRGGLVEGLRALGLTVKITRVPAITIPAATTQPQFQRAVPVP